MTLLTFTIVLILFLFTVQYVPTLYIPDFASSHGIPGTESALLVSFIGITNTLARIISGFIVDFLHVRSITLYLAAFSVITIATFLLPLCNTFWLIAMYSIVSGFCVGKIYLSVKYVMWRKFMYICFEIDNLHTPLLPYK